MAELSGEYMCMMVDRFNKFINVAAQDRDLRNKLRQFTHERLTEGTPLAQHATDVVAQIPDDTRAAVAEEEIVTQHDLEFIEALPERIQQEIRDVVVATFSEENPLRPQLAHKEGDDFDLDIQRDEEGGILTITLITPRRETAG